MLINRIIPELKGRCVKSDTKFQRFAFTRMCFFTYRKFMHSNSNTLTKRVISKLSTFKDNQIADLMYLLVLVYTKFQLTVKLF